MPNPEIPLVSVQEFVSVLNHVRSQYGEEVIEAGALRNRLPVTQAFESDSFSIPNSWYVGFFEACSLAASDPLFGAMLGSRLQFDEIGIYGQYVTSAPSLAKALKRACKAIRYHETGSTLALYKRESDFVLSYIPPTPNAVGTIHQSDGAAALLINLIRQYEGPDWLPRHLCLAGASGRRKPALETFFSVAVEPCKRGLEMTCRFGRFHERQSVAQAKPAPRWSLLRQLVSERPPETFAAVFRRLVRVYVEHGQFDLASIARDIALEQRTIQRRLREEGVRYSTILAEARRDYALRLLRSNTSVTAVGQRLGYSAAPHFCRAFKAWTGTTPSRYVDCQVCVV